MHEEILWKRNGSLPNHICLEFLQDTARKEAFMASEGSIFTFILYALPSITIANFSLFKIIEFITFIQCSNRLWEKLSHVYNSNKLYLKGSGVKRSYIYLWNFSLTYNGIAFVWYKHDETVFCINCQIIPTRIDCYKNRTSFETHCQEHKFQFDLSIERKTM